MDGHGIFILLELTGNALALEHTLACYEIVS